MCYHNHEENIEKAKQIMAYLSSVEAVTGGVHKRMEIYTLFDSFIKDAEAGHTRIKKLEHEALQRIASRNAEMTIEELKKRLDEMLKAAEEEIGKRDEKSDLGFAVGYAMAIRDVISVIAPPDLADEFLKACEAITREHKKLP